MREIALDKPIARGRTADVFDWDEEHVLKLFHHWFEPEAIEYELQITRAVRATGVSAPAVQDMILVHGRNGLVYERIHGQDMFEVLQRKPWSVFICARQLASLQARMHNSVFQAAVPEQRRRLQRKLQSAKALSDRAKDYLLKQLETMPGGDRVCHGDFHPGNVLMKEENLFMIDWIDASRGNPLADVARTSVLLLGIAENQVPNSIMNLFIKLFHASYLRHYFYLRRSDIEEYHRWLPIVAGARLSEEIPELEKWLVEQAQKVK